MVLAYGKGDRKNERIGGIGMENIEDAIYYLENSSKHLPNDIWDGTDEIIEMLKRGEKFEQFCIEIFNRVAKREVNCEVACDIFYVSELREIKQKYFPKEVDTNEAKVEK